jgi:hypothetical protein
MYSSLPLGTHTLDIVNAGVDDSVFLDLDRFVVSAWGPSLITLPSAAIAPAPASSASGDGPQHSPSGIPQSGADTQQTLSASALGGIAAASTLLVLLCALALVLCVRRRRAARARKAAALHDAFVPRGPAAPAPGMRAHDGVFRPDVTAANMPLAPNRSAFPRAAALRVLTRARRLGQLSPLVRGDFSPLSAGGADESFATRVRQPPVSGASSGRPDSQPPPMYSEVVRVNGSTRSGPRPPRPLPRTL